MAWAAARRPRREQRRQLHAAYQVAQIVQPLPTLPVYNLVDEERLVTVYGPLFGRDRARGRRKATLADLQNFIVEPMDLPFQLRHMDIAYAHVRYGDGDFMGDSIAFGAAADSILRFSAFSVAKIEVGVT